MTQSLSPSVFLFLYGVHMLNMVLPDVIGRRASGGETTGTEQQTFL
jgi:hypothetical protein